MAIREDRSPWADLGLREAIVAALLSYTTPYLLLALETLYGVELEPCFDPRRDGETRYPSGKSKGEWAALLPAQLGFGT
jgi:hypothetical protein